jgi:hypothetical protein
MTISRKCGPYIIGGTNVVLRRPDAAPTFVVLTDCSAEYYAQIRAMMGPDCLIEMRWTEPSDYQPLDNPEAQADIWWYKRSPIILNIPKGDSVVFAGYNEIGTDKADLFCRFEIRRLVRLHGAGYRAAVGSWGVGHPDTPEYAKYLSLFASLKAGDVLDFHEYASDYTDLSNLWHVGRFTIPAHAAFLGDWPIVISEYGYDEVEGHGESGWQQTVSAAGCLDMLRKGSEFYDSQPRVKGFAAFDIGSTDPKFRWFDMYGVWPSVVGEYAAEVVSEIPPTDTAPETPIVLAPPIREMDIVRITQTFDPPSHYGIDYSCYEGTPLFAAVDGIAYRGDQGSAGFGRYVRVEDGNGLYVYTAHMRDWHVAEGALVQAGDLLGYSGNTGNSTGPHLHFEVRKGSRQQVCAIDPEPLIVWDEPATVEPLPNDEQGDAHTLAQKARWWCEEWERQAAAGNAKRAEAIRVSLIDLLYRLENMLA